MFNNFNFICFNINVMFALVIRFDSCYKKNKKIFGKKSFYQFGRISLINFENYIIYIITNKIYELLTSIWFTTVPVFNEFYLKFNVFLKIVLMNIQYFQIIIKKIYVESCFILQILTSRILNITHNYLYFILTISNLYV